MNTVMKKSLLWLACIVLSLSVAVAGDRSRVGTAGGQELLIPVGARGVGIGGASLSYASGVDAMYWNPAGLARMTNSAEATFTTMSYFADINVAYGAFGIKAGALGAIGVSVKSLAFGDIPITTTTQPDGTGQTYSPSYVDVGLTYSNMLSDRVSFGVTATLVTEQIMSTSASAIAFSGGVQYSGLGLPGLSLGVAVKNVGSSLNFAGSNLLVQATAANADRPASFYAVTTAPAELPTTIEVGLSYLAHFDDANSLRFGGNFQNNNYDDDEWKVGAEYTFQNLVFVRGGYDFAPTAVTDIAGQNSYMYDYSFGAGVRVDLGGAIATLDYGYRHMKILSANNVITVTLGF